MAEQVGACLVWVLNVTRLTLVRFTPDGEQTADTERGRRRAHEGTFSRP